MSIQVRELNYIYSKGLPDQSVALKDVSFEIGDGEFVGIIGHTGSGKSTLLQHLDGLLKPTSGTVVINGTEITAPGVNIMEVRRRTGLVFQYPEYQLFEETVEKDVAFGPANLGLDEEETAERVREAIGLVRMDYDEVRKKSPFDLSGGEKRRIAIAGVIAMKPDVLILDEPTAGLDPKAHKDILEMIEKVHDHENNITILVSHKMDDIARLADKVLVMEDGCLVMNGTPEEIFSQRDKLDSMGLNIPEAALLAAELRERGLPVREGIMTIEQAEEEIASLIGERR